MFFNFFSCFFHLFTVFCSAGREKNLVTGSCDICPRGYYKDNTIDVFSFCTLCPIDKITAGTGAENMAACNIGKWLI